MNPLLPPSTWSPPVILQFFVYEHLSSEKLKAVSREFSLLAWAVAEQPSEIVDAGFDHLIGYVRELPRNDESKAALLKLQIARVSDEQFRKADALRLLLEAKDCAVRSVLFKEDWKP